MNDKIPNIKITWVPTIPECNLALTIALCMRTKLDQEFSIKKAKLDIIGREIDTYMNENYSARR